MIAEPIMDMTTCMECGRSFPYGMASWRLDERVWVPWCPECLLQEAAR